MESAQEHVETFNSQEFMEYLNEYRLISMDGEDPTDDENPPEEGEEEAEWLRRAGFDSLLAALEPTSESGDTEWEGFVTLSHRQAAVVRRRLHVLRNTLQKRRSATPDSLDSLSPPLTPPEEAGRRQAGSPHSQGYHSSSRGSLDRLEPADDERRASEYRHVLRIPVDPGPLDRREQEATASRDRRELEAVTLRDRREQKAVTSRDRRESEPLASRDRRERKAATSRERLELEAATSCDRREQEAPTSRDRREEPGPGRRRRSRDVTDRGRRPLGLFESSGYYELDHRPLSPPDPSGIETVSFQPVGSVRHHRERTGGARRRGAGVGTSPLREEAPPGTGASSPATEDAEVSDEARLGRTRLGDLSETDVQRVQKLALLELTGLFDEHGLSYSRRKARRRRLGARSSGDGAVVGASLASLLKRDRQRLAHARPVPLAFEKVLAHLERHAVREEGLLRVPGHRQKTELLRQLVDECFYSQPGAVDAALQRSSANDVAALLKQMLRQLPAPLLTDESMEAFHRSDALPAEEQRQALALLCLCLPAANRALLRRLLAFLATIAAHEPSNKMSLENVAMIMAPNLIPPGRRRQRDISEEITFASVTARVVRRLVLHREQLWVVPPQFIRQVRHQHEEELYERARRESGGAMKKLLRRRDTAIVRKIDNEVDFQEGVIRVSASQFGRSSWPVRLAADTTAGDLVTSCLQEMLLSDSAARERRRRRRQCPEPTPDGSTVCALTVAELDSALHTHFLHEHGGNIGERRLEHGAVLLDCYQENPNARWVLHCCHGPVAASSVQIVAT
ncbi:rho GTPase-activating protein 40-like [Pollicipes pollicipes]|uniref:rho GTPase-activating protein 40-like n=1 Tax=Pollicipes pollicipes TaxID=41117 RepID=UPI001885199C|nr:rho GTPase-activating protein 40-like [Pollicipes pollicipes]